jgi:hypothetical protein
MQAASTTNPSINMSALCFCSIISLFIFSCKELDQRVHVWAFLDDNLNSGVNTRTPMDQDHVLVTVQLSPSEHQTIILWDGVRIDEQVALRSGVLRDLLDLPAATVPLPISPSRFREWVNHTPTQHATAETLFNVLEVRMPTSLPGPGSMARALRSHMSITSST